MEKRTFLPPDVRFDSEIEFCAASWQRKRKYVSWNHWFTTKAASHTFNKIAKTIRFKLFELGHYAGSVILEIGLNDPSNVAVAIKAAEEAGHAVQYFGLDYDAQSLLAAHSKLTKKRVADRALLFRGGLSEFRNRIPVTPTMVIVNQRTDISSLLSHLSLFLADGTPVLIKGWFQSRGEHRSLPQSDAFEYCGRFGECVLLRAISQSKEQPRTFAQRDFEVIRQQYGFDLEGSLPAHNAVHRPLASTSNVRQKNAGKQWPFFNQGMDYPETLPDGSPWPSISIVTPSLNQGKYIEQTINSVLNQGYPNVEYIVVDGGSTDETSEILEHYRDQLDHCLSEPDRGQSDAINKGMRLATGDILTWLNSDDMLTPGALHAMAMAFWRSNADMVVGAVQLMRGGKIVSEHMTSVENGPLRLAELLDLDRHWLQGRFFFQPEVMFTRELWERAGGYVDPELFFSMDHELWLRFALAQAQVHVIGRAIAQFRVHDEQKTNQDYQPELRRVNRGYVEKYGSQQLPLTTLQPKKYRTTLVNDVGARYGAGIAHGRLRDMLEAAGHETTFLSARGDDQSKAKSEREMYLAIENSEPDLVVFGNLHNSALGMSLVDNVSERWPTSFVMHDLWLATGRCNYMNSCTKFKTRCDEDCPTSAEYPALLPEQVQGAFEHKLNVISQPRHVVVCANSDWTRRVAEESAIASKGVVKTLKLGFPTHIFKPRDQDLCREILGLPTDAFIVLFASVNVDDERKGLRHLFEALNRLQLPNLVPVCIGNVADQSKLYPGTISLGYVDDPWRSALIYAAADVFVGPSLEEAFGQVFIEAAACGTPAIAYPVGGVEEAVVPGVTGLLATEVHPSALADQIEKLYLLPELRKKMAVWGRIEVENEWSYRSSYHCFNNLLRQVTTHTGFLPPAQIRFDPSKTAGLSPTSGKQVGLFEKGSAETKTIWGMGFGDVEEIELHTGLVENARWAVGNTCELKVCLTSRDCHRVVLTGLNPIVDQRVTVFHNGIKCPEIRIENREDFLKPVLVVLAENIEPGEHQFRLEFEKTVAEECGNRNLAMLFIGIDIDPVGETSDHLYAA